MKEEDREKQIHKEVNHDQLLREKHQINSNTNNCDQSQNKKEKSLISQDISNKISLPTVIFNYKGELAYIQCNITDNIKTIHFQIIT